MAGINFNIDLRRRAQEAEQNRILEQQQMEAGRRANLLVGNRPEPGFAGPSLPGLLQQGPQTQIIESLLRSQDPQIAASGIAPANALLQQQMAQQQQQGAQKEYENVLLNVKSKNPLTNALLQFGRFDQEARKEAFSALGEEAKPFTLSENQRRFGGDGAEIAYNAKIESLTAKDKQSAENKLRDDFVRDSKPFTVINEAMSKLSSLRSQAYTSPVAFASMIVQLARLNSTGQVTEEDFNQLSRPAGISEALWKAYHEAKDGTVLPGMVDRVYQAALSQYQGVIPQYELTKKQYTDIGNRNGLDTRNIILDQVFAKTDGTGTDEDPPQ